ncbi:PqiC family protein [Kangiella shandongensis]|uniref:PqiC family protein n=1 Tax=Kangiella shandongensis TaxID=2763258 RepID=UPI001CC1AD44|nr:PqiC family protein [Kangiella shandongensis]
MNIRSLLSFVIVLSVLAGCSTRSPNANFYLLQNPLPPESYNNELRVGLGPVTIADYLQKPQIALRTEGSKMQFAEFERWASDLRGQIIAALQYELSTQLSTADVFEYPWRKSDQVDVALAVDIKRFDASFSDLSAYLHATVTFEDENGHSSVRSFVLTESFDTATYDAAVSAERRLLAQLGRKMVQNINEL